MPRGGKRSGSGRPPRSGGGGLERKTALKIAAPLIYGKSATEAVKAADILASVDEKAKWLELLEAASSDRLGALAPDWNTRRQALEYLTDQRDGKAKQRVEATVDDKRDVVSKMSDAELDAAIVGIQTRIKAGTP